MRLTFKLFREKEIKKHIGFYNATDPDSFEQWVNRRFVIYKKNTPVKKEKKIEDDVLIKK